MRLIAEGLVSSRGGRPVFSGLSLIAEPGRALVVTGPNGAGKSTLLRLLAGLLSPDAGVIRLEDDDEADLVSRCHYVGHADALKGALTAAENLAFWAAFFGGSPTRAAEALERLGIARLADTPAGLLSAGQKRRLGLARLLVAERPVWLLDEPTSSLDSVGVADLRRLMADHLASGGLLVAATHLDLDLSGAATLALGQGAA